MTDKGLATYFRLKRLISFRLYVPTLILKNVDTAKYTCMYCREECCYTFFEEKDRYDLKIDILILQVPNPDLEFCLDCK